MSDQGNGLYDHQYQRFFLHRDQGQGYDFQANPPSRAVPPKVTFTQRLRWWTWDRWRRRKKIRAERDRRLEEIVRMASTPPKQASRGQGADSLRSRT